MTWVQTYTGRAVDLLDPQPETISIHDIAHGLSLQCRFKGATRKFYSVAQHSVLVSLRVVEPFDAAGTTQPWKYKLHALLHDAHEAYIGDMPQPVKQLPEIRKAWMPLEERLDKAIFKAFGLEVKPVYIAATKEADAWALAFEKVALLTIEPKPWTNLVELPLGDVGVLECWGPREAERRFLRHFSTAFGAAQ